MKCYVTTNMLCTPPKTIHQRLLNKLDVVVVVHEHWAVLPDLPSLRRVVVKRDVPVVWRASFGGGLSGDWCSSRTMCGEGFNDLWFWGLGIP